MTELSQRLDEDYLKAVKAKDAEKTGIYRLLKAALKNEQIAKMAELDEIDVMKVFQKEAKKRQEAILVYQRGGRDDLKAKEEFELAVIKGYLPAELADEEIVKIVNKIIQDNNFSQQDFSQAMKLAMAELKGRVNGAKVGPMVKELLASK